MNIFHQTLAIAGLVLGFGLASESIAQNAIADWHAVMESSIASTGRKNAVALPYVAYVDVAMYDAVNSIDRHYQPFAVSLATPRGASQAVTPGHPEYPANHGCGTEAVMDAFATFFETDDIPLTVTSAVTGSMHSFNSFSEVVAEVDNARIYGGMHYRHSVKDGNRLGRMVAEYTFRHYFRRNDHNDD